jgi:hypothetical protein
MSKAAQFVVVVQLAGIATPGNATQDRLELLVPAQHPESFFFFFFSSQFIFISLSIGKIETLSTRRGGMHAS